MESDGTGLKAQRTLRSTYVMIDQLSNAVDALLVVETGPGLGKAAVAAVIRLKCTLVSLPTYSHSSRELKCPKISCEVAIESTIQNIELERRFVC